MSGPVRGTRMYNNLIFLPAKPSFVDHTLLKMDNWGGAWPEGTWLGNNIFYTEDWARYDYGQARRTRFETNLYWGEHRNAQADPRAVWADPLFVELYISPPPPPASTGFLVPACGKVRQPSSGVW